MAGSCAACGCTHAQGRATHAVCDSLAEGDLDRALALGLLDVDACPGCDQNCTAALLMARDARVRALAARDRFRAREARLDRRRRKRDEQHAKDTRATATASPLPTAAAAALARAKAKAATTR